MAARTSTQPPAVRAEPRPARWLRWTALLLLIGLGAWLRLHALDQLPPGLYHDEAFYGLDAQRVLHGQQFPIFFTGNNGREPLHLYLLAGAMGLLGERVWALRLVSALAGVLSIPLMYQVGRALLRGTPAPAAWGGVLAAAVLTVTYWHVNFSRVVFRAVDLVPLSLLAVWALLAGARRGSRRLYVLSGVALGLCLYTYLSARMLPLVFLGLALAQFLPAWRTPGLRAALRRPLVAGNLTALVTAALVFAPLGAYFVTHPQAFGLRTGSLSVFNAAPPVPGQPAPTLASNVVATVRMFVDHGDGQVRHNLPGRPAFDLLGLAGFWVGLAAAAWHWRQARGQLLLLWLGLMLLPTTLSVDAPHFLRAIGALPPACLLAADGLARLAGFAARAWPRLRPRLWPLLAGSLVLFSGAVTYRDYFVRFAHERNLAAEFDLEFAQLAEYALALSEQHAVVVPLPEYLEPTALFYLNLPFGPLRPIEPQTPVDAGAVLLGAPEAHESLVLLSRGEGQTPAALFTRPLEASTAAALQALPRADAEGVGVATGVAPLLPRTAVPSHPLDFTFDERFRLTGYDLTPEPAAPGDILHLTLYWDSLRAAPEDYFVALQLQTPNQDKLAQLDRQPGDGRYPTTLWRPGSQFTDAYTLTVPADISPGLYTLSLGLYQPNSLRLLPVSSAAGPIGDSVRVGTVTLPGPGLDAGAVPHPQVVEAGQPPLLRLHGYDLAPAAPGGELALTLYWEAVQPMAVDYTLFVHVLDESGALRAQQDSPAQVAGAPTTWWPIGRRFATEQRVSLPADLPPGAYTVAIGLYDWATGQRLPLVAGGAPMPDDRWLLPEPARVEGTAP